MKVFRDLRVPILGGLCALGIVVTVMSAGAGKDRVDDDAQAAVLAGWQEQLGEAVTNVAVLDFMQASGMDAAGWFAPPNPPWLAGAGQLDGAWLSTGWRVAAATPRDQGALLIALKRGTLGPRLWLGLRLVAADDAEVYLDLLDANALPVAVNLYGNLLARGATATNALLNLPWGDYPAATVLAIRRGKGGLTVPLALVAEAAPPAPAPSAAGDALTVGTNSVAEGSAPPPPAGPAADTVAAAAASAAAAAPGDRSPPNDPDAHVWYVNVNGGNDKYNGHAAAWDGQHGPFATLHKAMKSAHSGDTVVIAGGRYYEDLENGEPGVKVLLAGDLFLVDPDQFRGQGGQP